MGKIPGIRRASCFFPKDLSDGVLIRQVDGRRLPRTFFASSATLLQKGFDHVSHREQARQEKVESHPTG